MAQSIKKIGGKFRQQYVFLALAAVMVIAAGFFTVWSIIFLANSLNTALTVPPARPPQAQFDIQAFQKLNLTQ